MSESENLSEITEEEQNDSPLDSRGKIKKGRTLNPNGRPKGTGHIQRIIEQLPVNSVSSLFSMVYLKAEAGDMVAAKIILDRVLPIRKGARVQLNIPTLTDMAAVSKARLHTMELTSEGVISLEECQMAMEVLETNCKLIVEEQILPRLQRLEEINGIKNE